jgi:hypothetical protein
MSSPSQLIRRSATSSHPSAAQELTLATVCFSSCLAAGKRNRRNAGVAAFESVPEASCPTSSDRDRRRRTGQGSRQQVRRPEGRLQYSRDPLRDRARFSLSQIGEHDDREVELRVTIDRRLEPLPRAGVTDPPASPLLG